MQLPFSLFLALRFLKPKRTFLSVITVVSVLGVTLGIAVLIVVISVMTGFDRDLRGKILGFDSHVNVTDVGPLVEWRSIPPQIQSLPGVTAAAPSVTGPVLAATQEGRVKAVQIRGIDPAAEGNVQSFRSHLVSGSFQLSGESTVIGSELAQEMGIRVGDRISVYPARDFAPLLTAIEQAESSADPKKGLEKIRSLVLATDLTVAGIFTSGRYQYDASVLLVPLRVGQDLFGLENAVHGVSAWLKEPDDAPRIAETFRKTLPPALRVTTWLDENQSILEAITTERNTMFFILLFIVVVAAFSIMNTLITVTVMKTREIGVMKALGATRHQIVWVFLTQGMVVGLFGNCTGVGLGFSLLYWRNEFKNWLAAQMGQEIFSAKIYQLSEIPAVVDPGTITAICLSAFAICSLAALFPALVAARLDPVKALRHD